MSEGDRERGQGGPGEHCVDLVRRYDPDRFVTTLFVPPPLRRDLCALYAFNHEIARVREAAREPLIGQMRLQWWRDAIEAAAAGATPRQHPVALELDRIVATHRLPAAPLLRLVDTREADLEGAPPPDVRALLAYAEGTAGELMAAAATLLGAADARPAALALGTGWGVLGLLRALAFHARLGAAWLPADLAARHGLAPSSLLAPDAGPGRRDAVRELAAVARERLLAPRRSAFGRAGRSLLGFRSLGLAYLSRLARAGHDPADPRFAAPLAMPAWRVAVGRLAGR